MLFRRNAEKLPSFFMRDELNEYGSASGRLRGYWCGGISRQESRDITAAVNFPVCAFHGNLTSAKVNAARRREKQPEIAYRGSCKYVFRDRTVSSGRVTSIRMLCRTL